MGTHMAHLIKNVVVAFALGLPYDSGLPGELEDTRVEQPSRGLHPKPPYCGGGKGGGGG